MKFKLKRRNSLVAQWLRLGAPNAEGRDLILGWGTKIPYAARYSLKDLKNNIKSFLI